MDVLVKVSAHDSVHSGDLIAQATGLLAVVKNMRFRVSACLTKTLLGILAPADNILQSRQSDLTQAMVVVEAVKEEIVALRTESKYEECVGIANGEFFYASK